MSFKKAKEIHNKNNPMKPLKNDLKEDWCIVIAITKEEIAKHHQGKMVNNPITYASKAVNIIDAINFICISLCLSKRN